MGFQRSFGKQSCARDAESGTRPAYLKTSRLLRAPPRLIYAYLLFNTDCARGNRLIRGIVVNQSRSRDRFELCSNNFESATRVRGDLSLTTMRCCYAYVFLCGRKICGCNESVYESDHHHHHRAIVRINRFNGNCRDAESPPRVCFSNLLSPFFLLRKITKLRLRKKQRTCPDTCVRVSNRFLANMQQMNRYAGAPL